MGLKSWSYKWLQQFPRTRVSKNSSKELKERLNLSGHKLKHISYVTGITQLRLSDIFNGRVDICEWEHDLLVQYLEIAEESYLKARELIKNYENNE